MEFMIQRYYDGELVAEEETMLHAHLSGCVHCDREFREFGALFGDIGALQVQVAHRDILSQTLHRLEEAEQKRRMDVWWRGVAVAASVLIIAGTAFLNWTDSGKAVKHEVSAFFSQSQDHPKTPEQAVERPVTDVEHDRDQAYAALANIYTQVGFPLLELGDKRLQLDSTSLIGGDEKFMYQMVELEYTMAGETSNQTDTVYFLATPDSSMKDQAKSNVGHYVFSGEAQAGPFLWAKVGAHAITAEINGVFYQIFSPFLSTQDLLKIAETIQKR
ncbi:zf-HC2 domain-containing protein [Tumebacillus sp. ITR2]|uniref:Zf-HC2 domain-containing protein n=2 Tax=Tumebacillus amylolyticus TaxID=2801339 RepID=A0ABS1J947_9BACL|nr:zf-HC2 domain-containing protein [Tumebacillus amylolyticus]